MDFEIKRQRLELDKKKFAYECKRDEQQGTPTSQPQGTKANNPNDDGASSKADEPMQTEDCHSVVMKDLWKRVVA
jgi:hypothetical protein